MSTNEKREPVVEATIRATDGEQVVLTVAVVAKPEPAAPEGRPHAGYLKAATVV